MGFIRTTYEVTCDPGEVEKLGREIALEQTVEVPESMVTDDFIREEIVGTVDAIRPVANAEGTFRVDIHYNSALASDQIGQLLNLVYGNISMKRRTRLVELELPDALLDRFTGPKFGIEGIREQLGVYGRPLLATALKPRGSSNQALARMAYDFALGGGDLVKDDHNLVEVEFDAFRERIDTCQQAVEKAQRETGRPCLYFPNVSARAEGLERRLDFVAQRGIPGVLISPLLIGFDQMRALSERYPVAFLAHPTFSGAFFHDPRHGVDPGILLGRLFRMAGADGSIFPNTGGRFTFDRDDCSRIADSLRSPMGRHRPAFPVPAGGMRYETLPTMGEQFGADTILLIGGALLSHSQSLRESTGQFMKRVQEQFPEKRVAPKPSELLSACEVPSATAAGGVLEHMGFEPGFSWTGRSPEEYKSEDQGLPFRGVRRVELIGKNGEKTAFDLRYFEIEPGGYTSLEKHRHTHVVIGARGRGVLVSGEERKTLNLFDVGYVPPLRRHQLRNESSEPFGFFCIVDHDRDRPMPA